MNTSKIKKMPPLLAFLICFGCVVIPCRSDDVLPMPSLLDVISMPSKFDGKKIVLRGWISMRFEDVNLWVTWEDHEKRNDSRCISLMNQFKDPQRRKAVDGKYVEIVGTFRKDIASIMGDSSYFFPTARSKMVIEFDTEALKIIDER